MVNKKCNAVLYDSTHCLVAKSMSIMFFAPQCSQTSKILTGKISEASRILIEPTLLGYDMLCSVSTSMSVSLSV